VFEQEWNSILEGAWLPVAPNYLVREGIARTMNPPLLFQVPGAWSWTRKQWLIQSVKNVGRFMVRRPLAEDKAIILFEIVKA
jgi:hypothetical protein